MHPALEVAKDLGPSARVVSMPFREPFEKQSSTYKQTILQGKVKISIEAGIDQVWHKYIGTNGIAISLSSFGESRASADLAKYFEYTKEAIINRIKTFNKKNL